MGKEGEGPGLADGFLCSRQVVSLRILKWII